MKCEVCEKRITGRNGTSGDKYHFCSSECRQKWRKENVKWPKKYNRSNQRKLERFAKKRRNGMFKATLHTEYVGRNMEVEK